MFVNIKTYHKRAKAIASMKNMYKEDKKEREKGEKKRKEKKRKEKEERERVRALT
jgi:hypothetical protein